MLQQISLILNHKILIRAKIDTFHLVQCHFFDTVVIVLFSFEKTVFHQRGVHHSIAVWIFFVLKFHAAVQYLFRNVELREIFCFELECIAFEYVLVFEELLFGDIYFFDVFVVKPCQIDEALENS